MMQEGLKGLRICYDKIILVGKLSKTIKFRKEKWNDKGGDNETGTAILKFANLEPRTLFIIISRSDFSRLDIKPKNIYDLYKNQKPSVYEDNTDFVLDSLGDLKPDQCIIFSGRNAAANIPNRIKALKSDKLCSPFIFSKVYVAPIYHYLNVTGIRYTLLINDPRFVLQGRDLFNTSGRFLSMYDEIYNHKHILSYDNQELQKTKFDVEYSGIERIAAMNYSEEDIQELQNQTKEKDITFGVLLNEGMPGKSRYNILKEYVLDNFSDCTVVGSWDEEITRDDKRFLGTLSYADSRKYLSRIKYTFLIPIAPGWVTSKYIEVLLHGVIPFFHFTYDLQSHIDLPDFLRVNSAEELKEKVNRLENDITLYYKIYNECISTITEEDLDGSRIWNTIGTAHER